MVALVLFGFYPAPLLDVSNPTVYALLDSTGSPTTARRPGRDREAATRKAED